jgi:transposase
MRWENSASVRDFGKIRRPMALLMRHQTSGFVEGQNNKLKVLKRRGYGLHKVGWLGERLTLDLDGYRRFGPSPTATR